MTSDNDYSNARVDSLLQAAMRSVDGGGPGDAGDATHESTLDDFHQRLQASRLFDGEQWAEVDHEVTAVSTPRDAAARLLSRGLLTGWQSRMLLAGQVAFFLGRYKLLNLIGTGGMGSVYRALHTSLDRVVALKVLADRFLHDEALIARFQREMRAAASLDHPNIVHAYDADVVGKTNFIVMEYVEGEDLAHMVRRRGEIPVGEACEWIRQAALGLAHAHEHGMVHRDIKPANLIVAIDKSNPDSPRPVVKILDFGLAQIGEGAAGTQLTAVGQVLGTVDFMSPEQADAAQKLDARSDIYSLGATLFRLIAGRVPFPDGGVVERLNARLTEAPDRLSTLRPGIPEALDELVHRMLSRDPDGRPQSASDVAESLLPFVSRDLSDSPSIAPFEESILPENTISNTAILESFVLKSNDRIQADLATVVNVEESEVDFRLEPIDATQSLETKRSGANHWLDRRRRNDRRKTVVVLAVIAVLLAAVVGMAMWFGPRQTTLVVDWPVDERENATLQVDGRDTLLDSQRNIEISFGGNSVVISLTRDGYEPIEKEFDATPGETISFRPAWVPRPETKRALKLRALESDVRAWLANVDTNDIDFSDKRLRRLYRRIRERRRLTGITPEVAGSLPWPCDQLRRAKIDRYEFRAATLPGRTQPPAELVAIFGSSRWKHWDLPLAVAFSPDGKTVASGGLDGFVCLWDRATGMLKRRLAHPRGVRALAYSPDGSILATGCDDGVIKLWKPATGTDVHKLHHSEGIYSLAFFPDGRRIAFGAFKRGGGIWHLRGRQNVVLLPDEGRQTSVAVSPDGQMIGTGAYIAATDSLTLWDAATGKPRWSSAGHKTGVYSVAFSRDSKTLVAIGNPVSVRFWNVATGRESREPLGDQYGVAIGFNRKGTQFAWTGGYKVRVIDFPTGKLRYVFDRHNGSIQTLAFDPPGQSIVTAAEDNRIQLWDLKEKRAIPAHENNSQKMMGVAVTPDGRRILSANKDGTITSWNSADGRLLNSWRARRNCFSMAISPDGESVATSSAYVVQQWRIADGKMIANRVVPSQPYDLAYSPSGRALAYAGVPLSALTDVATGEQLLELSKEHKPNVSVAIRPNGRQIAFGSTQRSPIRVINITTGRLKYSIKGFPIYANVIAYSPDGELLVTGGATNASNVVEPELVLWDAETRRRIRTLQDSTGQVGDAAFSPDGTRIASTSRDGIVRVFDVASRRHVRSIPIGPNISPTSSWTFVSKLAWTPDGRHIVVANGNGTVYVLRLRPWNAAR